MATELIGATSWEEALYEHFLNHEQREQEVLTEYRDAVAGSRSAAFRFLMSLIIDDEVKHHEILDCLASTLRNDVEWRGEEPAVPRLSDWEPESHHIVELTERFLQIERADAAALKKLSRELKDVKDTTMWQLMAKVMEKDTAKHIEILEFLRDHAR